MGVYLSELMALNHEKDHVSLISHSLHTVAVVKYVGSGVCLCKYAINKNNRLLFCLLPV